MIMMRDVSEVQIDSYMAREVIKPLITHKRKERSVVDLIDLITDNPANITTFECAVMSRILVRRLGHVSSWVPLLVHKPLKFQAADYLMMHPDAINQASITLSLAVCPYSPHPTPYPIAAHYCFVIRHS